MTSGYSDHISKYEADGESAKSLIGIGKSSPDPALDPAELAAFTNVASVLMNLDETVTKE